MSNSKSQAREGLVRIASDTFDMSGDMYRLVTFLNQSLKDQGIIFGLSKSGPHYSISIYRTDEYQPRESESEV